MAPTDDLRTTRDTGWEGGWRHMCLRDAGKMEAYQDQRHAYQETSIDRGSNAFWICRSLGGGGKNPVQDAGRDCTGTSCSWRRYQSRSPTCFILATPSPHTGSDPECNPHIFPGALKWGPGETAQAATMRLFTHSVYARTACAGTGGDIRDPWVFAWP